jgi:hypothetical protein
MLCEIYADRKTIKKNFGDYENKDKSKALYITNISVKNDKDRDELEQFLADWVRATEDQSHHSSFAPDVEYDATSKSIVCYIRRYSLSVNISPFKNAEYLCENPTQEICSVGLKKSKKSLFWGDLIITNNPYKVAKKKTEA